MEEQRDEMRRRQESFKAARQKVNRDSKYMAPSMIKLLRHKSWVCL